MPKQTERYDLRFALASYDVTHPQSAVRCGLRDRNGSTAELVKSAPASDSGKPFDLC
ncbi:MAG TPA: hypothetical protein VF786_01010 [Terriglobales bacterium]